MYLVQFPFCQASTLRVWTGIPIFFFFLSFLLENATNNYHLHGVGYQARVCLSSLWAWASHKQICGVRSRESRIVWRFATSKHRKQQYEELSTRVLQLETMLRSIHQQASMKPSSPKEPKILRITISITSLVIDHNFEDCASSNSYAS